MLFPSPLQAPPTPNNNNGRGGCEMRRVDVKGTGEVGTRLILLLSYLSESWRWYRVDALHIIIHFFYDCITLEHTKAYSWIHNLWYIFMSCISKPLDNNSFSEILYLILSSTAIFPWAFSFSFLIYSLRGFVDSSNLV